MFELNCEKRSIGGHNRYGCDCLVLYSIIYTFTISQLRAERSVHWFCWIKSPIGGRCDSADRMKHCFFSQEVHRGGGNMDRKFDILEY